jgi:hypothetical protein
MKTPIEPRTGVKLNEFVYTYQKTTNSTTNVDLVSFIIAHVLIYYN